jgi:putative endonuclease
MNGADLPRTDSRDCAMIYPMPKQLARIQRRLQQGRSSETLAAQYLAAQGLMIVARNVACKMGELDLVCLDGRVLVIVEVRQRSDTQFGGALASVTQWKQRKIIRATHFFLQRATQWRHLPLRFDVIAINGLPDRAPQIHWVKDAFRA